MTTPAIQVSNLVKTFGKLRALDGVSFTVNGPSVFCILGPNGAGKTTLLRILTTMSHPDSGTAEIEGHNVLTDTLNVRHLIGVVSQENHFDSYMTIWHNLSVHAQMHGMSRAEYEPRITELLHQVRLYDRRFNLADQLSGGMQRRVALIRALIHRPKVLFLDEPTTGLDPQARLEIWEAIEHFKQTATVILTTHYMDEADRLGDRIMMINHGQIVMTGTPTELKQSISPLDTYQLTFRNALAAQYQSKLNAWSHQHGEAITGVTLIDSYRLQFQVCRPEALRDIVALVDPPDFSGLSQTEANLEDVFMSVARNKPNKANAEASI